MSLNFYLRHDQPRNKDEVHIGKTSVGWVFCWQGFDAHESPSGLTLHGGADWRNFLTAELAEGATIQAETGDTYPLEAFFAEVEHQHGLKRQSDVHPIFRAAGPDDVCFGEWS